MHVFVTAVRTVVMDAAAPRPYVFAQCSLAAALMLAAGGMIFKKTQDQFIFYI